MTQEAGLKQRCPCLCAHWRQEHEADQQETAYIIVAETMSPRTLSPMINHLLDRQVIFSIAQEKRDSEVRA